MSLIVTLMLVELIALDPRIKLDIRYATPNNFCNEILYKTNKCFIHKEAAQKLKKVQDNLAPLGLYLKVFDAYRPLSVQQKMWDLIQNESYVSDPSKNKGRHTRGTAVDLTLVDEQGYELEMPSEFDEFSERAHRDTKHCNQKAKQNMLLLQKAMEDEGFEGLPLEWWHFDLKDWQNDLVYPALDICLEDLESKELMNEK